MICLMQLHQYMSHQQGMVECQSAATLKVQNTDFRCAPNWVIHQQSHESQLNSQVLRHWSFVYEENDLKTYLRQRNIGVFFMII